MSATETRKNPSVASDNATRSSLIHLLMDYFMDKNLPVDRINDYGTLCVDMDGRPVVLKVVMPKLYDKDGEELFSVDTGILEYEARVQADKAKAEKKAQKEAEAEAKRLAIEARRAAKNSN